MHTPVLLQEVLDGLAVRSGGRYIDATAGEGGHLKTILDIGGVVLAIDWDPQQIDNLKLMFEGNKNVTFAVGNFSEMRTIAFAHHFYPVDGILIDLGLSMRQLEHGKRGFSYKMPEEPLDMRLSDRLDTTAADLVNSLSAPQLYEILAGGSEEINSRAISEALVGARTMSKIKTVSDLLRIIDRVTKRKDEKVYARVFQALRIAVNGEFQNLRAGLKGAMEILKDDGRIVVLTFHSLEDRIVKRFVNEHKLSFVKVHEVRGSIKKGFERSARLRVIQKMSV